MDRQCVICGQAFKCSPSDKKVTCSKECSVKRKRQTHLGKSNQWSAEAKRRQSALGVTPNLALGTPAASASPKSGPYETNQNAKLWALESPDGKVYQVKNLNLFAREHCAESDATPQQMASGIRQIKRAAQGKCRYVGQWKGWRLLDWGEGNP